MKQKQLRISAFALSLLMLIASNSYAISSRFCGEELVDVSYFGSSSGCCSEIEEQDCALEPIKDKDCCVDSLQIIDSKLSDFSKEVNKEKQFLKFQVSFIDSYFNLFREGESTQPIFLDLPPPSIEQNYQVLYQSFLI